MVQLPPEEVIRKALQARGFLDLNPVQSLAMNTGLLNGKNLVVCAPTSSGKTLIAEIAALNTVINKDAKAVYVGPLRALAHEHYDTFKKNYEPLGLRVAITTGDLDSSEPWLKESDWIVSTYEKLESLIIHKAPWLKDVKLLIVDEVHLLDTDRGPALEVAIARLRKTNPQLQVLALSATIPNYLEIAKWLNAEFVTSDWRPVMLSKGVYWENGIKYDNKDSRIILSNGDPLQDIITETLKEEKQALVFRNSRKNAQASAKALRKTVSLTLRAEEREELAKLAAKALKALESPTSQCLELSDCIKYGTAFHTAGLMHKQREIVQKGFNDGLIKIISCTPTLAAGVNMAADIVIVKDTQRYTGAGLSPLSTSEVLQMFGRAGRPPYSQHGEAVCIANSEGHYDYIWEKYVNGSPEPVYSRLGVEPVLRTQVLNCIASGFTNSFRNLREFFTETFYGHQYANIDSLMVTVASVLEELEDKGFIEVDGDRIMPTRLGVRTAELALDPLSAHALLQDLERMEKEFKETGVIYAFAQLGEMSPFLSVPASKEVEVWEQASEYSHEFYQDPVTLSYKDVEAMNKFRLALMLRDWVHERDEETLMTGYGVAPGILHAYLQKLDWLSYAGGELAKIKGLETARLHAAKMRRRFKYGVLEELLPLVAVKGIGRKRARILYNAGLKTPGEVKKAGIDRLKALLGEKTAEKISSAEEKIEARALAPEDYPDKE